MIVCTTRRRWTTPGSSTRELGYRDSALEAARGADIVLHLTEWAEFREMDPAVLGEVVADAAHRRRPQRARPRPPGAPPAGPTAPSAGPDRPGAGPDRAASGGLGREQRPAEELVLGGLRERPEHHLVDVDVQRQPDHQADAVGDVLGGQRVVDVAVEPATASASPR